MASNKDVLDMLTAITRRLDSIEVAVGLPSGGDGGGDGEEDAPYVKAYDEFASESVAPFVEQCKAVGAGGEQLAAKVETAFAYLRAFLVMASKCKKPDAKGLRAAITELQGAMKDVMALKDNRSPLANHLNATVEAMQALGWVCVEPTPVPFIESALDGAVFWSNKVRQTKKNEPDGQAHIEWCNKLRDLLKNMAAYVKKYHTTGVSWNPRGGDVSEYSGGAGAAAAAAAAPKPAPAPAPAAPKAGGGGGGGGGMASVFAQIGTIDQSSGKTEGLRHVSDKEKVYKNASLRAGSTVGTAPKSKAGASAAAAPAKPVAKKPPRTEYQNGVWYIEHHHNPSAPVEVEVESPRHKILVYNCTEATIIVNGKCNMLSMDKCSRTNLLFDACIASCEVVNCQRAKVQVKKYSPSVSVDKTDGCIIYLNAATKDAQIVTSKSSEVNVSFPEGDSDDSEWVELPIPEQFVHVLKGGKVASSVSDLYG